MGKCRVCGTEISGSGRRYCREHVPPVNVRGYILVYKPDHPKANKGGYIQEHVVVMEQAIGRLLRPGELVHHEDGNRGNNSLDNLVLFASTGEHLKHHAVQRRKRTAAELKEVTRQEWLNCWYDTDSLPYEIMHYLIRCGHSKALAGHAVGLIISPLRIKMVKAPVWARGTYNAPSDRFVRQAEKTEATFLRVVERIIAKLEKGERVTRWQGEAVRIAKQEHQNYSTGG